MAGRIILILLATSSALGTIRYDFDKHHIFNPLWPVHARFHGAAFALLTVNVSFLAVYWLCVLPFGERPSIVAACSVMSINAVSLGLAALVPGVSSIARSDEKIWLRLPISIWMTAFSLLITWIGFTLAV